MTTDSQKVALVTGGARGIGKATVDRLVREGLKVVATDISPNNDLLNNAHVLSHAHDVSSSESWSSVLDVVSKKFGRLDILVNNAGTVTNSLFQMTSLKSLRNIFEINFFSQFLLTQIYLKLLNKSAAYHASKGVVSAVTRNAAIRYASENIRINAVSPGFVKVAREEKTIEEAGDEMSKEILIRTPMNRWADPSEIAAAINFLAGNDATYITGVELFVDGGWMAA